jgi:hypothetical protein
LVWEENFGSGTFTDRTAGQALAAIIAGQRHLFLLGQAGTVGIATTCRVSAARKAGHVGAAIALRDVVGEAQHVLVVAVVPPHGDSTVMPSFSPVQ